jgi:hypothetical protein
MNPTETYLCSNCNKEHKIGYHAHLKYKVDVVVPDPKAVDRFFEKYDKAFNELGEDPTFKSLMEKVERLENRLDTIIVILKAWKVYIDRKHPYARNYHQFFLILDGL